ncbi:src kinase-associated phosphoprotein 2-A-like isoform X2 [Hetaerina americana]
MLLLPQEYVDMSGCIQSTDDDSFSESESQSDIGQGETDSWTEPVEYENEGTLFPVENIELAQEDVEENLNLTDANPPSASELEAMTIKCGPLKRKDRFMFIEQLKNFWAAVYANKLYFYSNQRDAKPQHWISLKEYTAKSAPNAIRDSKKKASCFEISSPGNKTLQFIARTPKDMQQWIAAINHPEESSDLQRNSECKSLSEEPNSCAYEDVGLVFPNSLEGATNGKESMRPTGGEDDAIYNDIDTAFQLDSKDFQDIYDDTDTTKKYEEPIYDDVETLRNVNIKK